jgi:beta-glucosidase
MVLLKNEGLLPLAQPEVIAVIGPNADAPRNLLGDYSYQAMSELMAQIPLPNSPFLDDASNSRLAASSVQVPSILAALRAHAGQSTQVLYAQGCCVSGTDRSGFEEAVRVAGQADVVILVLGDKAGLVPDCTSGETRDRAELGLPGVQEDLARAVVAAGKPVVAVLVNGRPLSIPWLHDSVPAILEAWLPGEEGASAVVDVLFGVSNPGGKLPISVARSVGQLPIYYNYKPSGRRSNWYTDYADSPVGPLYPFGHGLSYTTFAYSDLAVTPEQTAAGQTVEVSLSVANAGKVAGDEVVQLYIQDEYASVPRPLKELKGFCRLSLQPGETRRVTFSLPVDMLAFYDQKLDLVVEAGAIKVMVGSSSEDIRLEGAFEITETDKKHVQKRVFTCPVTID